MLLIPHLHQHRESDARFLWFVRVAGNSCVLPQLQGATGGEDHAFRGDDVLRRLPGFTSLPANCVCLALDDGTDKAQRRDGNQLRTFTTAC